MHQENQERDKKLNHAQIYFGNPNLKKVGVSINWTENMIEEYIKCSKDPIYFNETYVKIINVDEGLVNFKLYDYQKEMMSSMHENRRTIITTCRQSGKSTTTVGYILWYILFNSEKTVALLANKGDTAREILSRIQLAYEHLPPWLQQGVTEWNKGSFILENNSRVLAAATSGSAIRGYSINLLFIDECAHIENWDEFFKSVFPTISSGKTTKIILVSTPNGLNHFHKTWKYAITDDPEKHNGYHPVLVMWDRVPGRDLEWKRETLAQMNGDLEAFSQEHECEFMGSSGTLINGTTLKSLVAMNPIAAKDGLLQYFQPKEKHKYIIVADVSRGKGLDHSAFSVFDVTKMPYQQVCIFRDNLTIPSDYASIIHRVSKMYNDASILVETNDIGGQVADSLFYDFEADGLLYTEGAGRNGKKLSAGFSNKCERGIRTSTSVKAVGCSLLKLLVEQQQLIVNDHETIFELSTFSRKGKSYEAEPGRHDDLVMGFVLFAWMTDQQFFKDLTDINTMMKLREKTEEEIERNLVPFGVIDLGGDELESDDLNVLSDAEKREFMGASAWKDVSPGGMSELF